MSEVNAVCPDCGYDHAALPYKEDFCPVVRVPWPPRAVVDAFWRGDAAMCEAEGSGGWKK